MGTLGSVVLAPELDSISSDYIGRSICATFADLRSESLVQVLRRGQIVSRRRYLLLGVFDPLSGVRETSFGNLELGAVFLEVGNSLVLLISSGPPTTIGVF